MAKNTKKPVPIRPELIEPLTEIICRRGNAIHEWPADEVATFHGRGGGFKAGHAGVHQVRMSEAAAAIEDVFRAVIRQAYIDGVAAAQAMTGFTDETFQADLDKEGITRGPDGRAL